MGKKLYKCDIRDCEKLFSTKFSLKRHNLIHLNSKKHICKHCQKAFALPQYLEEHEYTHTGAKPFICGINGCQEQFRQRGKLSIHKKNAHPDAKGDQNFNAHGNGFGQMGLPNDISAVKLRLLEDEEEKEIMGYNQSNQQSSLIQGMRLSQGVNQNVFNQVSQHQHFASNGGSDSQNMLMASTNGNIESILCGGERNLYSSGLQEKYTQIHPQMSLNTMKASKLQQAQALNLPNFMQEGGLFVDNIQVADQDLICERSKESNQMTQYPSHVQFQKVFNSSSLNPLNQQLEQKGLQPYSNIKQGAPSGQQPNNDIQQQLQTHIQNMQQSRGVNKDKQDFSKSQAQQMPIDHISNLTAQQMSNASRVLDSFSGSSMPKSYSDFRQMGLQQKEKNNLIQQSNMSSQDKQMLQNQQEAAIQQYMVQQQTTQFDKRQQQQQMYNEQQNQLKNNTTLSSFGSLAQNHGSIGSSSHTNIVSHSSRQHHEHIPSFHNPKSQTHQQSQMARKQIIRDVEEDEDSEEYDDEEEFYDAEFDEEGEGLQDDGSDSEFGVQQQLCMMYSTEQGTSKMQAPPQSQQQQSNNPNSSVQSFQKNFYEQ